MEEPATCPGESSSIPLSATRSLIQGTSVNDCYIPVDLILQSVDGVKLGAHKLNLQTYADGFSVANSVMRVDSVDDIPVLTENSDVLRLMLRFMHHALQPDLDEFSFETVAAFADAAEKYFIFSAIGVCKMYMLLVLSTIALMPLR